MDLSTDSDYSDTEISEILTIVVFRRTRIVSTRPNLFYVLDDKDFYDRILYSILELIGHHIKHPTDWNHALTEEQMLLITLRVYGTSGMLQTIGDLFGASKSTVSKVITLVSHHIACLRERFIIFPKDDSQKYEAYKGFYIIAKFPTVIGALDGTHVKIISPGGNNSELYRNRKGVFSINVQTMCDANLKITNIVARWPGSAHDSNILRNSRIYSRFENGEFGDSLIVADSGYPNKKFMITPLSKPITPEENLFNESLIRTRCNVERSYGVWKRRFPILSLGIRLNHKKVQSIIVATAVLHNICCTNNENDLPLLDPHASTALKFNHLNRTEPWFRDTREQVLEPVQAFSKWFEPPNRTTPIFGVVCSPGFQYIECN
ncbi:putative nuclease HARBI1 [Rhagoletis pomonella]|uniref:putative nuclease HARBI1 n=1 Tax=Rhagoletis pomonella TaxID=28610 RepID=UPI001783D962|nr:putative nuclease HARBI1 [Rhagoletis pomonella]